MNILKIEPVKPQGWWNNINPWSNANKQFKEQQKIWWQQNSSHIDRIKLKIKLLLKIISHLIGVTVTGFFTLTPVILPKVDHLICLGTYNAGKYYFSWADHIILTMIPICGHIGLNIATKLGTYGKALKYILFIVPVILTTPYLIYQHYLIRKHKKECKLCQMHSNKIQKEKEQ